MIEFVVSLVGSLKSTVEIRPLTSYCYVIP